MMKRVFDIVFSCLILLLSSPLFLIAIIGIMISSTGPIFYLAPRVGKDQKLFLMYKFRSMAVSSNGPVITSLGDARIFRFGAFLRKTKIDELPQFFNVILGDMSVVGPRPEDPKIVGNAYKSWMMETLKVKPGITSPGSIFYYHFSEKSIDKLNPETNYVEKILPKKLAIELSYIRRANFLSDIEVVLLTAATISGVMTGKNFARKSKDMIAAENFLKNLADSQ